MGRFPPIVPGDRAVKALIKLRIEEKNKYCVKNTGFDKKEV